LILIALAPPHAVAQTPQTPQTPRTIAVTLSPGESTKSVQAPRDATFAVSLTTPIHICDLPVTPTVNSIVGRFAFWANQPAAVFEDVLSRMESFGTDSGEAVANALTAFLGVQPWERLGYRYLYSGGTLDFTQGHLSGGPFTHTLRSGCYTVDEARTILNEIRRAFRAYLGLPAPTN